MIRIICNKKIELTDDEYKLFQDISSSYDEPPMTKGETLFQNLFETDDDGIIQFLRPPSQRYTSMEVFLFLVSVFQQQHARVIYGKLEDLMKEVKMKVSELDKK